MQNPTLNQSLFAASVVTRGSLKNFMRPESDQNLGGTYQIIDAYNSLIYKSLENAQKKTVFIFDSAFHTKIDLSNQDDYDIRHITLELELNRPSMANLGSYDKLLMPVFVGIEKKWDFVLADLKNSTMVGSDPHLTSFRAFFQEYLHLTKNERLNSSRISNTSGASNRQKQCEDNLTLW